MTVNAKGPSDKVFSYLPLGKLSKCILKRLDKILLLSSRLFIIIIIFLLFLLQSIGRKTPSYLLLQSIPAHVGIQHEFEVRHEYVGAKRILGDGPDIMPLLSTAILIARTVGHCALASFMPLPAIAAFGNIFRLIINV